MTLDVVETSLEALLLRDRGPAASARAEAKGLDLACDVSAAIPTRLLADPVRLRQIVTNPSATPSSSRSADASR